MYSKSQTLLSNVILENYENMFHFRHLIMISSKPVHVITQQCCMVSGEDTNTHCTVFDSTGSQYLLPPLGTTIILDYLITGHGNLVIHLQILQKMFFVITSGSDYFSASFA